MPRGVRNDPHSITEQPEKGRLEADLVGALGAGPATFETLAAAFDMATARGRVELREELRLAVGRMRVHYHHRPRGARRRDWPWPAARVYSLDVELQAGSLTTRCVACAEIARLTAERPAPMVEVPLHRGRARRGELAPADAVIVAAVRRLGVGGSARQVAAAVYGADAARSRTARVRRDLVDLVERGRLHVEKGERGILFTTHADGCTACEARTAARSGRARRSLLRVLADGPATRDELQAATRLGDQDLADRIEEARKAGAVAYVMVERGGVQVGGYATPPS